MRTDQTLSSFQTSICAAVNATLDAEWLISYTKSALNLTLFISYSPLITEVSEVLYNKNMLLKLNY